MGRKKSQKAVSTSASERANGASDKVKRERKSVPPLERLRKRLAAAAKAQAAAKTILARWEADNDRVSVIGDAASDGDFATALDQLAKLASEGYTPPASVRGRAKYVAKIGDHVYLKPGGIKRFGKYLTASGLNELYVGGIQMTDGGEVFAANINIGSPIVGQARDRLGYVDCKYLVGTRPNGYPIAETPIASDASSNLDMNATAGGEAAE